MKKIFLLLIVAIFIPLKTHAGTKPVLAEQRGWTCESGPDKGDYKCWNPTAPGRTIEFN